MVKRRNVLFILVLFVMLLSACAPKSQTPGAQPGGQTQDGPAPSGGMVTKDKAPFVLAAKTALSQKLGIPVDQISFVAAESVQWTDSCLGLGGPAESCLQAVTPGYKVILNAQGTSYELHTNEMGDVVRLKG